MKLYLLSLVAVISPLLSSCASDSSGQGRRSARGAKGTPIVAAESNFDKTAGAQQMGLQNEVGVYDTADIEETMAANMDEVRACYGRAGRARRYAAGKVNLRFVVDGQGKTQDVLVVASELGNYEVERCLVDLGRGVKFPAPNGNKGTSFEYPVEFRSTREMEVQDLEDSTKVERDITASMHSLASCGAVTATGATASFYIEPTGLIGSVGLAGDSVFDEQAGACMVRAMRRWRMSATLPGRMLRYRMSIPAVIASAEPPPSRRAVLSAAGRRRHR